VYFRKKWYLLTTLHARHCIDTEIGNLKAQAQHVSERRTRYGVENPGVRVMNWEKIPHTSITFRRG
jgi:hypothetical protein